MSLTGAITDKGECVRLNTMYVIKQEYHSSKYGVITTYINAIHRTKLGLIMLMDPVPQAAKKYEGRGTARSALKINGIRNTKTRKYSIQKIYVQST